MGPKLIVCGAAGRMGRRILSLAIEADQFDIIGAVEKADHPDIGKDAGIVAGAGELGINIQSEYPPGGEVVIDFSQPEGTDQTADYCLEQKAALILGTTGLSAKQHKKITEASAKIPLIYGTNMSVGMNVLFATVGKVAKMLGEDYDVEIVEQHHRFKKDAPSGSALTLAENICAQTGDYLDGTFTYGRSGKDAIRQKGTIGIHAVRAGDIAGVHDVIFSTLGETITLSHNAHSRDNFARGALRAAKWLAGKKPAQYSMADVLGLK
ncbi:MAG: 4-hydroxy-tetrahydrodipicolinate reductase [Planctomycetes bacterium]|nr:4-hydroxy-tetrahydrodipicolinate reductase [Planctomycetota bacterium]